MHSYAHRFVCTGWSARKARFTPGTAMWPIRPHPTADGGPRRIPFGGIALSVNGVNGHQSIDMIGPTF